MAQGLSKRIRGLQFAFLSPERDPADERGEDDHRRHLRLRRLSDRDGVDDLHLGVIEPNLRCRTCGGRVNECPGHFGIIELAMPVIHVGYAKEVKRLLQSTCRACGRVLPDAPSPRAEAVVDSDDSAPAPKKVSRPGRRRTSAPARTATRSSSGSFSTNRPRSARTATRSPRRRCAPGSSGSPTTTFAPSPSTRSSAARSGWCSPSSPFLRSRSARRSRSKAGNGARTTSRTSSSTCCGSTSACGRTATWAPPSSWSRTSGSSSSTTSPRISTTRRAASRPRDIARVGRSRPSRNA